MDFLCFSFALLLALIPNLIASILSFIFFLFGVSLWLLINANDFIGLIFILVYIGAIAVLFIFVTMLIHFFETITFDETNSTLKPLTMNFSHFSSYEKSILIILAESTFVMSEFLDGDFDIYDECIFPGTISNTMADTYLISHIYVLASLLFTFYFPSFIVIAIILLFTTYGIYFILFQKGK